MPSEIRRGPAATDALAPYVEADWPIWPALSVHQPWATLIALGCKRIETRGWRTRFRGNFLIHAARTRLDPALADPPAAVTAALGRRVRYGTDGCGLPFGALVGAAELVDCVPVEALDAARLDERRYQHRVYLRRCPEARAGFTERDLGDYTPGRFAWVFGESLVATTPFPWRGRQGWFRAPAIALARPRLGAGLG